MSTPELRVLLDEVPDTRDIILLRLTPEDPNVLVWRDAADAARRAYGRWRRAGGPEAYAAYRAAQDREDAAQDALAA